MKEEQLEHYFKTCPEATEVFATSDGNLFVTKPHAEAYAYERLKDKEVVTYIRGSVIEATSADEEELSAKESAPTNEEVLPVEEAAPNEEKLEEVKQKSKKK